MNKVEVKIEMLSYAKSQVGSYVIVLSELDSNRKLPIIIKAADAQYIACRMEGIKTPRPMTQDLFKTMSDAYQIDIQEVMIHNVLEGIFYSKITTSNSIEILDIECTVGDALSMAVLYNCPIYVNEDVMIKSSVDIDNTNGKPVQQPVKKKERVSKKKEKPAVQSVENLSKMLSDAVEEEDYELAVSIRDRIDKLKIQ
jgi:hypothetical protein